MLPENKEYTLGEVLKAIRSLLGLSQRAVADILGLDESSFTKRKDEPFSSVAPDKVGKRLSALLKVCSHLAQLQVNQEAMLYALKEPVCRIDPKLPFMDSFSSSIKKGEIYNHDFYTAMVDDAIEKFKKTHTEDVVVVYNSLNKSGALRFA